MKLLQVPFCFDPDPVGGTEVYVKALSLALQTRGHESRIAAPGDEDAAYQVDGLEVRRFAVEKAPRDLSQLYGEGDSVAAEGFARILDEQRPDLVHLHAWSPAVSLRLVEAAQARGLPVIFTYHTPTVTCQRGTLLEYGEQICDGHMEVQRCTRCALHGRGLPRLAAAWAAGVPTRFGAWLGQRGWQGGLWTVLRSTALMTRRQHAVRELFDRADHIVAVCQWVRRVLERNGVPADRISLVRQGLCYAPPAGASAVESQEQGKELRVAFFGRIDRSKGVEVLCEAVRRIPETPLVLDLFGVCQGAEAATYRENLRRRYADDKRIRFREAVPANAVVQVMRGYHLVAVPSQVLETGPLVVLEAFAARVPVIGAKLGGIMELVRDEANGLLVEAGDIAAWARTLKRCAKDPCLLQRLRAGLPEPRTMDEVAGDMERIYEMVQARRAQRDRVTGRSPARVAA